MKVIAISGWKRSGKDTVAEYLIKEHGFTRFGFADTLKDMVAEQYGIPRSHCDDPNFKEEPILTMPVQTKDKFGETIHNFMRGEFRPGDMSGGDSPLFWTPRALCILEGSVKRSARTDYWVKKVVDNIYKVDGEKVANNQEVYAVISDLRYRSELGQLREAFGSDLITVRINRFEDCPSTDPSERDLDNAEFDVVLSNTGTLEELYEKVNNQLVKRS